MPDNPTKELLTALSEFQKTTLAAHKDNSTGRFKYATETSINDTIRSAKNSGLATRSPWLPLESLKVTRSAKPKSSSGFPCRVWRLPKSTMLVADYDPKNTRDIRHQQRGSGISYAKRYLLAAAFGIATEENEGECLAEDIEAEAKAPAKPKAKANTLSRHLRLLSRNGSSGGTPRQVQGRAGQVLCHRQRHRAHLAKAHEKPF